jgi:hypothetical protein
VRGWARIVQDGERWSTWATVMPWLGHGIHAFLVYASKVVDADPGRRAGQALRRHDERRRSCPIRRGSVAAAGVLAQPLRSTTSYTAPIEREPLDRLERSETHQFLFV